MHLDSKWSGKVIVITGATGGIGREIALQLAPSSPRLVLVGRDEARLSGAAQECARLGAAVYTVLADLSNQADCARAIDEAVNRFGGIDALFCVAGQAMKGGFASADAPDATVDLMRVNYGSVVYLCHRALPQLLQRQGRIAVVAGLVGHVGVPGYTAYSATKHAVVGFCRALRHELATRGVSVTLINPDTVRTGIRENMRNASGSPAPEPYGNEAVMEPADCARHAIAATEARQRECSFGRVRLLRTLQAVLPNVLDNLLARSMKAATQAKR